jgi:glucose/arabinose dehydrogenase
MNKYRFLILGLLLALFMNVSCSQMRVDLTNENSPQSASFRDGRSYTELTKTPGNSTAVVGLMPIAENLTGPMTLLDPDDGTGRLFIADQIGVVFVRERNGTILSAPLVDVSGEMVRQNPAYDERGLLGFALHPDFKENGRLFVYYSAPLRQGAPAGWSHTNRLSEFEISGNDSNIVDAESERVLLEIDVPYRGPNGGQIRFGPDGDLYIPTGDGESEANINPTASDEVPLVGTGQNLTNLLGKVLRIDVDNTTNGKPYAVPADNPFVGIKNISQEIYAYGFRDPATASFDSGNGHRLFIGDPGQDLFESIDIVLKGGNYGWNIREGTHCFNPMQQDSPLSSCSTVGADGEPLIGPIIELGHDIGEAVIGGYVYRGTALPGFQGRYIFADWSTETEANNGTLLVATPPGTWNYTMLPSSAKELEPEDISMWSTEEVTIANNADGRVNANIRGFGEDANHELYIMTSQVFGPAGKTGKVYKIIPV